MLRKGNREFTFQPRWDRSLTSVRPKCYEGKQRDYNPISVRLRYLSVGPICLGFVVVAMTFVIGGAGLEESVAPVWKNRCDRFWL